MIRNMVRFSILALTAVFLAACAAGTLVDSPTGSITFAFPKGALSRGIGEETYRVVIYYGLDRYEAAPAVSDDRLTFTGIPTGDVRIIVARGAAADDGFFYTKDYGELFIKIVPGDNGPYDLNLKASEFVWVEELKEENVNGLVALGDVLYASTAGALSEITYTGDVLGFTPGPPVDDGIAVSSLSLGKVYEGGDWKPQVWVNGTWNGTAGGGIMPWDGGTLDPDFSRGFGNPAYRKDGVPTDFEISYSGAFEAPDGAGLAIVFQRDGGMGGVYLTPAELALPREEWSEWPWIVDEINFEELLGDVVEEGTEFVKELIVSPKFSAAYIVTSLFTMKVSEDFVTAGSAPGSAGDFLSSDLVAVAPYLGSDNVSIELGVLDGVETIYVGTENGLYAGLSSDVPGEFFGSGGAALVTGTAGYYIKLIEASPDGNKVAFAARRGTNPDLLIVVDNQTEKVVDLRGLQGLPGIRLSNLVWLNDDFLAVSGDHGLAVLDVTQLF